MSTPLPCLLASPQTPLPGLVACESPLVLKVIRPAGRTQLRAACRTLRLPSTAPQLVLF